MPPSRVAAEAAAEGRETKVVVPRLPWPLAQLLVILMWLTVKVPHYMVCEAVLLGWSLAGATWAPGQGKLMMGAKENTVIRT